MARLENGDGVLVDSGVSFGVCEFRSAAVDAFPQLSEEIDEHAGIHEIMGRLDDVIVNSARDANFLQAEKVLFFIDSILGQTGLDPEIPNAVSISFVEPVVLDEFEGGRRLWLAASRRVRSLVLENKNRTPTSWE